MGAHAATPGCPRCNPMCTTGCNPMCTPGALRHQAAANAPPQVPRADGRGHGERAEACSECPAMPCRCPALPMPGEDTASAGSDLLRHVEQEVITRAEFAPRAEFADAFADFYGKQRPETARWMRQLERVLRMHALPALQAQEHAWRAVTGHAAGRQISFRVDVNRGGKRSRLCGVTSLLMEEVNVCVHTVSLYACSAPAYPWVHGSLAANAGLLMCQCIYLFTRIPCSTNIHATNAADTFTCIRKHSKCACNLANMRPYIAAGRPVLPPPRLES